MYPLICLVVLGAIISPGALFPSTAQYRPFFVVMLITLIAFFLSTYNQKKIEVIKSDQAFFILGLLVCEVSGYFITEGGYLSGAAGVLQTWLIIFLIFFIPAVVVDTSSRVKTIIWIIILAACCVYWEGFKILKYFPELMSDGRLGSYGMYAGANDFALILVMIFPMAFKLFFIENSFVKKSFLLAVMIVIPYLLMHTVSRGGMLGLAAVMTLSIFLDDKPISSRRLFSKCLKISPLLLIFFAIGLAKLATRGDAQSFSAEDASAAHRIIAWKAGLHMMLDRPWGIGYDNFTSFAREYGAGRIQAHNTIVKVGAEAGFLGMFCYLSLIYSSFKHLLNLYKAALVKQDRQGAFLIQAISISLAGFFLCTQFSVKEHENLLYINLALTYALTGIYGLPRKIFTGRDAFRVGTLMLCFFVAIKFLPA